MEYTTRQKQIIDLLSGQRFASIRELAQSIYVSEATIRRELQVLEQKGILKTVYGGVVLQQYRNEAVPVSLRDRENAAQKEEIARRAAELVRDNETIILDASSTVRRICRHILSRKNLTVITNNLRVCQELKDSDVAVYCTGGMLVSRRECFLGSYAEDFIRRINADHLFFSSQGVSENGLITDSAAEEVSLRKTMLSQAKHRVFLCDSSKLGRTYPFTLCHVSDVEQIISDTELF